MNAISGMAVLVGGLGVLNTMLMSVLERTREIGVLRAMGWRRRSVLGLIMREALILGLGGGLVGILVAFLLAQLMYYAPGMEGMIGASWTWEIFARAVSVALFLGLLGGIYPAYRATRLPPVEALRYE
jgi:putative ABC transport system permease protein